MSHDGDADELILYATPSGELGRRCEELWERAGETVPTTEAQSYPPPVTLTGFFHRAPERTPQVVAGVAQALEALRAPAAPVASLRLDFEEDGVVLVVESATFREAMDAVVAAQEVLDGEDELRPKEQLHSSRLRRRVRR